MTDSKTVFQQSDSKWFDDMRDRQRELSDKVSEEITGSLLNKEKEGEIREYLGFGTREEFDLSSLRREKETYRKLLLSDVSSQVFEAVIGYTEYLGCRLVRNDLKEMPLPLDSEIPYDKIVEQYGPSVPLLRDVIGRMNVQPSLPLIGRLENGKIVPDVETMSKWKDKFDWSLPPESSNLEGL